MAQAKTAASAMRYETSGTKKVTDTKNVALKMADQLSTFNLVWLLVKRHRVGLLAVGNIILVLNWAFPAWTVFVKSL